MSRTREPDERSLRQLQRPGLIGPARPIYLGLAGELTPSARRGGVGLELSPARRWTRPGGTRTSVPGEVQHARSTSGQPARTVTREKQGADESARAVCGRGLYRT